MAKSFSIIESLLPSVPNLKPKKTSNKLLSLPLIYIKMIHNIYYIQIYKNQDENLTIKMFWRLYSFVWL